MSLASKVRLNYIPVRDFRFERFYSSTTGKKMWQASCQFDVSVEIDSSVSDLDRLKIEYRQYIRGGIWVRRGNEAWTADNDPNGNKFLPIPPYTGLAGVTGIPAGGVSGTGLSLSWKEDGQVETGGTERYGYRADANVNKPNEIDLWSNPTQLTGRIYKLRDTPSIAGEWGSGDSVEVWIELWFKGFVVEVVQPPTGPTKPISVLKQKEWSYFWPDKKLSLWMDATSI
jgi:hypothetical protein